MRDEPLRLLLDTNVLLDEYISTRPSSATSRELIDFALDQEHILLYPARAIAEIAWGCVDNLCEFATAVGLDNSDVWLARKYRTLHDDFEDNFILAAAERAKVDFLVTSDQSLLRKATVAALSPQDMLAVLKASTK